MPPVQFLLAITTPAHTHGTTQVAGCLVLPKVGKMDEDPAFGPPDPRAVDYRLCRNRSLSVGDIVAVDGRFYACEPSGWQALQHAPRIDQRTTHGTTPLYESAAPARRRTIRDLGTVLRGAAAARWADLGRRVRALRVGHAAAAAGHGRVLRRRRR